MALGEPLVLASVLDDELGETLLVTGWPGPALQSLLDPRGLFHISASSCVLHPEPGGSLVLNGNRLRGSCTSEQKIEIAYS